MTTSVPLSTAVAIRDQLLTDYTAGKQIGSYVIEGRSVMYRTLTELRQELTYWQRVIEQRTAAAAGKSTIKTASWNTT